KRSRVRVSSGKKTERVFGVSCGRAGDRFHKLNADPDRRSHDRGGDPVVHVRHCAGTRYVGIEGPSDETAWLVDRLTGNIYRCQAQGRGKASCDPEIATGSIAARPKPQ